MGFNFKLLTGANPAAQYAAIGTKDPLTFYLLNNGIGYLGDTALFGGGTQSTVVRISGVLSGSNLEIGKMYVLYDTAYTGTLVDKNASSSVVTAAAQTGLFVCDAASTLTAYSDKVISNYIAGILTTVMTGEGYTGDDNTIASTKAIVDLIGKMLNDSSLINASFFRQVVSHTLTAEDMANVAISKPGGVVAGDVGLLFTADTDSATGGELYYYVSLKGYIDIYTSTNTNSITLTKDGSNNFTANLRVKAGEASIVVDAAGVSLDKTATINEELPSANKIVTEAALVSYIQNSVLTGVNAAITEAMADVITYQIDTGA